MSSDAGVISSDVDFFSQYHEEMGENVSPYDMDMVVYEESYAVPSGLATPNPGMIIVLVVIMGIVFVTLFGTLQHGESTQASSSAQTTAVSSQNNLPNTNDVTIGVGALTFVAPYEEYVITQGIHGLSYGHMAIDIAAGRGEPILSPINGRITQLYMDEYGNPTLVIENEVYQVMFLHGDYNVAVGDVLKTGQVIGTESNKGYTMDMAGNLCYNREWCGNHTHLNVFDKRIQANINPLDLFGG